MQKLERGPGIAHGLKDMKLNAANIASGITGMVFSVSGIVVIFSNIAQQAGLSQDQVVSWMFAAFLLGGVSSILFSLYYKMPIVFTNAMAGMALSGVLYASFDASHMVGGFIMAGALILLVGLSGLMDLVKRVLPIPIVMGMVVGIFLSYAIKLVSSVEQSVLVCGGVVAVYLLTMRFLPKVPAQLAALVAAGVLVALFMPLNAPFDRMAFGLSKPMFVAPRFSWQAFAQVSVPIALLALADAIKGYGVLKSNGYNPPMNAMTAASGLLSMGAGFMLSSAVGFAGVGTAIVATDAAGPKDNRYAAAVMKNLFSVLLALLVGFVYPVLNALPVAVSNVLAGLALLSLFTGSLGTAFGTGRFKLGAFAAMVVGIADVSVAGLGAPIVALAVGCAVSLCAEKGDFQGGDER